MDKIILGLLFLCSRTIYQLRERVDKGLNLMYSSSTGNMQTAIKKLLGNGYISYEELIDNGRYKKIYSITESGRQHFLEWVNSPIENQNIRCPELTKVYFMGLSDKENREMIVQQHLSFLKEQYCLLDAICKEAETTKPSGESRDILNYQILSAFYGRDLYKFNIDWFENVLAAMEKGEI